ncbi:MAG: DUF1349 domain-containing protein [Caldilinea sp. CFX5]|nr:DUF1349 domain-containing protein [Caldilinea sp. CFX5]
MQRTIILIFSLLISALPSSVLAADNVEKTICKLAVGYQDVDEIQADLLATAKREVINELFGEMIVASTAVENFVVTSDQIRTSSIGFVRVEGNAEFFNGKGFAEVCVTIHAYVTDEDMAQFNPEKLEKKYCDADKDMTTAQLITYVKEEAVIQSLVEYNPKLKGTDNESLLQLVQKVSYSESGFISDTQTYCANFEGYVVPVEVTAYLESTIIKNAAGANNSQMRDINSVGDTSEQNGMISFVDDNGELNTDLSWISGTSSLSKYELDHTGGKLTIHSGPHTQLWDIVDSIPMILYTVSGDFTAQVRLEIDPKRNHDFAGLGVRSTAIDSDSWIRMFRGYGNGQLLGYATMLNGRPTDNISITNATKQIYLRLTRRGYDFQMDYSSDAKSWTLLHESVNVPMPETVYVHLYVNTGTDNNNSFSADFMEFSVMRN